MNKRVSPRNCRPTELASVCLTSPGVGGSAFTNGVKSMTEQTRKCTKCGETKPLSEYYKDKGCKLGIATACIECAKEASLVNHRSKPPEYGVWAAVKQRCVDSNVNGYSYYGGKGIAVCARWKERGVGFDNFMQDMGSRPTPKHQIDRMDSNGDYTPENCRWVTPAVNARNRSNNSVTSSDVKTIRWLFDEGFLRQCEIMRIFNIDRALVYKIVRRKIWRNV